MYKLFITCRYLRRNWLNIVGVAAVAIAVMVPLVVLSVMKGFDADIRSRSRNTLSDLILERFSNDSFAGADELIAKIEALPHVESAAPEYTGLAIVRMKNQTRYAQFHGIDLAREIKSTDLVAYHQAWRAQEARDELDALLDSPHAEAARLPAAQVESIARRLRADDFTALPRRHRDILRRAAHAHGIDLAACLVRAADARPAWITVPNPKTQTPAFLGGDLAILGRSPDGVLQRLGRGEELVLIIPTEIHSSTRAFQRCIVSGYFKSGLYIYDDKTILLPLEAVQRRLDKPGHVTTINIRLDDFRNAPRTRAALWGILSPEELADAVGLLRPVLASRYAEAHRLIRAQMKYIRANQGAGASHTIAQACYNIGHLLRTIAQRELDAPSGTPLSADAADKLKTFHRLIVTREANAIGPQFRISTWQDKRGNILRAVEVERRVMAFILFFVTVVAGFLIFSILHTTVHVKTKDIGILKSIGAGVRGIMALFLLNGVLIGIVGAILGSAAGLLIIKYLNDIENLLSDWVGFRLFPRNIYYFDQIPVDRHPLPSAVIICLSAVFVSLLASAVPAWKAARMDPVEALRYE